MYIDPKDTQTWGEELRMYHAQRKQPMEYQKTKIITQKEVKQKETEFNPVLQIYADQHRDQAQRVNDMDKTMQNVQKQIEKRKKYMHEYNLVNLEPVVGVERPDEREKIKQNLLPPNFNDYNIITNEKVSEDYYKNMKIINLKRTYEKPVINRNNKDYNIINNMYLENHDEKYNQQMAVKDENIIENCKKIRNFNVVNGEYFDQQKENEYQEKLKQAQLTHGKNFNDRLPQSWKFRESVYLDQTKEVPEEIKLIDEINKNKKKRYQIRHVLENEYKERDIQDQLRAEDRVLHRSKYDDLIKKYDKEFDIITLTKPQIEHIVKALPPKPPQTSWDKVQATRQQSNLPLSEITIPDGIDIRSQSNKLPSLRSINKAPSAPRSEAGSQKSEIKSGGFFLK